MIPTTIRLFEGWWRIFVGDTPLQGKHASYQIALYQQRRIHQQQIAKENAYR